MGCVGGSYIIDWNGQGLDLARLTDKRQFAFVDGLSELFYTPAPLSPSAPQTTPTTSGPAPSRTVLPVRSQPGPVPARGGPQPAAAPTRPTPNNPNQRVQQQSRGPGPVKRLHLTGTGVQALDALENDISSVIKQLKTPVTPGVGEEDEEPEILLIVDQPDLLLAATGPAKGIGATEMGEWIMGLQQVCLCLSLFPLLYCLQCRGVG